MSRIKILSVLMALLLVGSILSAQIIPSKVIDGNVQTNAGNGFLTVASPTLSVPADTAVSIGTLPSGTKQVAFYVHAGADINYGPAGVASGTSYPSVASGSISPWLEVATTTPSIYLIGNAAAATSTILVR